MTHILERHLKPSMRVALHDGEVSESESEEFHGKRGEVHRLKKMEGQGMPDILCAFEGSKHRRKRGGDDEKEERLRAQKVSVN
jgi:hypothetical protein